MKNAKKVMKITVDVLLFSLVVFLLLRPESPLWELIGRGEEHEFSTRSLSDDQHHTLTTLATPLGDSSIPIHFFVFYDYACPACRQANDSIEALLTATARLSVGIIHVPRYTDVAESAAHAAICAEVVGDFGRVHDLLSDEDGWREYSENEVAFRTAHSLHHECPYDEIRAKIQYSRDLFQSLGLGGTPFFLGPRGHVLGLTERTELMELVGPNFFSSFVTGN